jgi:hypothetical protein
MEAVASFKEMFECCTANIAAGLKALSITVLAAIVQCLAYADNSNLVDLVLWHVLALI